MSGPLNSSPAEIPINISAVVFGTEPASSWAEGHYAHWVLLSRSVRLFDRDSILPCKLAESLQQSSLVRFKAHLCLQVHNCDHSGMGEVGLPH